MGENGFKAFNHNCNLVNFVLPQSTQYLMCTFCTHWTKGLTPSERDLKKTLLSHIDIRVGKGLVALIKTA